jgi:DNA-binding FadR family transcriptional regulator
MEFQEVVRRPAYVQVAEQLREAILDGRLTSGQALPAERDLCERFGVSRPTLREALRALQSQSLVVDDGPTAPLRVAGAEDVSSGPLRDALVHLVRLGGVSLDDLVDLRCALESAAAGRAARRPDRPDLSAAHAAIAEMRAAGADLEAFERADVRFHVELVAASGNEALELVMLAVRDSMAAHLLDALGSLDDPRTGARRLVAEHEAILAAVEHGDAASAEPLVRDHIERFYRREAERP